MSNSDQLKSPFRWIGGKSHLAEWVIDHFPEHHCYVEPFGGGAHVLFRKGPPSGVVSDPSHPMRSWRAVIEVYNDVNGDVVNFMRCLQDPATTDRLIHLLLATPYSRELYEGWLKEWRENRFPTEPVERAGRWFMMQRAGFGGMFGGGFGTSKSGGNQAVSYSHAVERLTEVRDRIRHVLIEHLDFREVIKRYDETRTLFYCDPPYISSEYVYSRNGNSAGDFGEFGPQDHDDLATMLNAIKGKAVLSYFSHPNLDALYPKDKWYRVFKTRAIMSSKVIGGQRSTKEEILLMNFDPYQSRPLWQGSLFESIDSDPVANDDHEIVLDIADTSGDLED